MRSENIVPPPRSILGSGRRLLLIALFVGLAVRVGCNLAEGQKLVVFGEPEHATLVRTVAEAGWRAGAGDVDCFYVDEHVRRLHALLLPPAPPSR